VKYIGIYLSNSFSFLYKLQIQPSNKDICFLLFPKKQQYGNIKQNRKGDDIKQIFFGVGSFVIFIILLMAYILEFFMDFSISNTLSIILLWLLPLIGINFGFLKKGVIQISGLIGNVLIFCYFNFLE